MKKNLEDDLQEVIGESKREFVKKLVTVAGAVAAAGLVAGASSSPADGATTLLKIDKFEKIGNLEWKLGKFKNGFRIVLAGRELGDALSQAGLIAEGGSPKITIEFTS